MSRCFPFPPPGYEKKARTDDTDLLTKEKHKEKKHKKDKKDKEKREGKEKKDKDRSKDKHKDRSKDKHKEKKDRKEKHKEKEKDKDRDKDKDKTLTSADKKAEKQPERSNGDNVGPADRQNVETKDSKYVQELSRRIRDEDRATGSQMAQNAVTDQRRATLLERVAASNIANKFKEGEKIKDEKTINGFRNHVVDPRVLENEVIRKSSGDGKAKALDQNNVEKKVDAKEKSEKHKNRDKDKRSKSKDKDRNKEKEKKEKVKKTELSKEQPKFKEGVKDMTGICIIKPSNHLLKGDTKVSVEGNLGVLKEVEMKKQPTKEQPKLQENGKLSPGAFIFEPLSRLKEDAKNSSSVDGILGKRKELEAKKEPTSKDIISKVMPVISNVKLSNHVKEDTKSSNGVGNLSKRKEPEMNGILNDNGVRPSKSQRLVSPIHPVVENGRKTEPCQIPEQVKPERQGTANNLKVEIKGHRINGLSDAQAPKRSSHSTANLQVNENGELCGKPPHPDSKYLNQILSLPKIEESLDHDDDQDWLFSCNKPKKPKAAPPEDRTSQVWAQSLKIESADVYALPYVIPY